MEDLNDVLVEEGAEDVAVDRQEDHVADDGVEVHEDVLHENVYVGALFFKQVLVVDARQARANDLHQDEEGAEAELNGRRLVVGSWLGVGLVEVHLLQHTAAGEYQQG